jgi:hypothetical protein
MVVCQCAVVKPSLPIGNIGHRLQLAPQGRDRCGSSGDENTGRLRRSKNVDIGIRIDEWLVRLSGHAVTMSDRLTLSEPIASTFALSAPANKRRGAERLEYGQIAVTTTFCMPFAPQLT